MNSKQRAWVGLLLLVLLGTAAPLLAQDPPPEEEEPFYEEDPFTAPQDSKASIEQILEEDEAVMTGAGYSYDSGQRRDPFKSLIKDRKDIVTRRGPRPEGKAGLLIDELDLTGLFRTPEGAFAQVRGGPKNKSYLLRAGDELYDGQVVEVRREEIVFKQQIFDDPAAVKPFREVVKRLTAN